MQSLTIRNVVREHNEEVKKNESIIGRSRGNLKQSRSMLDEDDKSHSLSPSDNYGPEVRPLIELLLNGRQDDLYAKNTSNEQMAKNLAKQLFIKDKKQPIWIKFVEDLHQQFMKTIEENNKTLKNQMAKLHASATQTGNTQSNE